MAKYMKVLPILAGLFLMQVEALAATYYVRTGGLDAHSCASATTNDDAHAKKTIAGGIGCMSGSDTLIIGDGTYDEQDFNPPAGSIGTPTIIQAANRNLAVVRPANNHYLSQLTHSFVTLDGIYLDCNFHYTTQCGGIIVNSAVTNLTWKNGTVFKVAGDGTSPDEASGIEGPFSASLITNMDFISVGAVHTSLYDHAIYLGTGAHDNIVDGNRFTNSSAFSVHNYTTHADGTNNIIRGNTISGDGQSGILIAGGPGNQAYNNIISGSHNGIEISTAWTTSAYIYSNTLYNNAVWGITIDDFGSGLPSGVVVKDNILYMDAGGAINDATTGQTCTNNFNVTLCGPTEGLTDPKFVSSGTGDFHLQSGSMAIGAGLDLSATFTTDAAGLTRTVPWDEGAYKFVAASIVPIVMDHVRRRH